MGVGRELTSFLTVPGTIGAGVALGLEFLLIVCWKGYYVWQNRRRDKRALESGVSREEQERLGREMGESDTTDMANPYFRYTM
jgi:ACS family allantoate permease-like MFS transporter